MLLFKTIMIFLKNKFKELGIISIILGLLKIVLCICGFVLICLLLGYSTVKLIPSAFASVFISSFYSLPFCYEFFLKLFFAGFFGLVCLIGIIGSGFFIVLFLVAFYQLTIYVKNESKYWKDDFKNFIKSNWEQAKITSGKTEMYLYVCKKHEYIIPSFNDYYLDTYESMMYQLKYNFNYIKRYTFTPDDIKNRLGEKRLKEKDINRKIKTVKLKPSDFEFIKVSDFLKDYKI